MTGNPESNFTITDILVKDIRFPTSQNLDGSDAMNPEPDYSATYVILKTSGKVRLEGHGLAFTVGRGNEICVKAVEALIPFVKGRPMDSITSDMAGFWHTLTGDSQIRWLGPEKGAVHMAAAAIINAVWDLYAKAEGKPLWKLLADMSPEELISCIDFSYITDVLSPYEALEILKNKASSKAVREREIRETGYPAYTTSIGWLGYPDEKVRRLCKEALAGGWTNFKMKVGSNVDDDIRRAKIIREEIGYDHKLMMDANQKWGVDEAIAYMRHLAEFKPYWIEEPTSPDDILGHAAIRKALSPIGVATGEHVHNRIMFKQLFQANAIDFCQIDSCRLAGVNEVLAVLLMSEKFGIPVCPHAGGVGLCEYVQHLSIIDYIAISGSLENRMIEYVDHLHEHFFDPVVIENGYYTIPAKPGYSSTMKPETLRAYEFPVGKIWKEER
ncbi:MAG TPA: L-fuconate dehydratase [Balneolales bacterium]|nr:L-fuconate dehydratase [Balneolales bacterium]